MFVGSSYSVPLHEGRQFSGDYWGPSPNNRCSGCTGANQQFTGGRAALFHSKSAWNSVSLADSTSVSCSRFLSFSHPACSLPVCLSLAFITRPPGCGQCTSPGFVSWLRGHYGRGRRRRGRCAFGPSYRCRRSAVGPAREPLTLPLLPQPKPSGSHLRWDRAITLSRCRV